VDHIPSKKGNRFFLFKRRKRRGAGRRKRRRKECSRHYFNSITLRNTSFNYGVKSISLNSQCHTIGMRIRRNISWYFISRDDISKPGFDIRRGTPSTVYQFPYIKYDGTNTLTPLVGLACQPQQIISSFFSTCFSRVISNLRKTKIKDFILGRLDVIAAIVAHYTVTQNEYIFRRHMCVLERGSRKCCRSLIVGSVSSFDENTRFVFRQIWRQVLWLTFRSRRIRDTRKLENDSFSIFNRKMLSFECKDLDYGFQYNSMYAVTLLILGSIGNKV